MKRIEAIRAKKNALDHIFKSIFSFFSAYYPGLWLGVFLAAIAPRKL
jgi:hypothetical protein